MRKSIVCLLLVGFVFLSTSTVDVRAIAPEMVCDEYGCISYVVDITKTVSTPIKYYQDDYLDIMYGGCGATIKAAGCALTSFAMVLANLLNDSTNYTPPLVNTGLYNGGVTPTFGSCSYNADNWGNKSVYKNSISMSTISVGDPLTTRESIYYKTKDSIDANRFVIFRGGPNPATDHNHFSLIYGYRTVETHYFDAPTRFDVVSVLIVDTDSQTRTEINQFLAIYQQVTQLKQYRKD